MNGTVKSFTDATGYGSIKTEAGTDLFFASSAMATQVAKLADARELYIRSLIERGQPVPEPSPPGGAPCCDEAARARMLSLDNRHLRERIAALESALVAAGKTAGE